MPLDAYQPCPCGSGKKIKFCCSHEIMEDVDKILRKLESEQRLAALDDINRLFTSHPDLPVLFALKGLAQMQMGEMEAAGRTVDAFVAAHPANPVALAQSAMLQCAHGKPSEAIDLVQKALASVNGPLPVPVYDAIGTLAEALLRGGELSAARGHLLLHASISGGRDEQSVQMLFALNNAAEVPLLLKNDPLIAECPADVSWRETFEEGVALANKGHWAGALELWNKLLEQAPDSAPLLRNIATLAGWLGKEEESAARLHQLAALPNLSLDDAVEAEAIAQTLDPATHANLIDLLQVTFTLTDGVLAMEQLLADRRAASMPIDPRQLAREGEPPPKGCFWLLDRELPETGVGITREAVPCIHGEMLLFGRQTDKPARIELLTYRSANFEQKVQALRDLLGDTLTGETEESVLSQAPAEAEAVAWNWRLPDDTPAEHRDQLIAEQRRHSAFEVWPNVPMAVLGGKTPREAAEEQTLRVPLLAAILRFELECEQNDWNVDFNELRTRLSLPVRQPLGGEAEIENLPPYRLRDLVPEKLNDEQLVLAFRRGAALRARLATRRLGKEIVERESLKGQVDRAEVFGLLSRNAGSIDQAVNYIEQAGQAAIQQGQSPAKWLLTELTMRIERGEAEHCQRILNTLQARHRQEPGVMQALAQILMRYGLIRPDGSPATPADIPSGGTAGGVVSGGPQPTATPGARLLTGSEPKPAGGGGKIIFE